MIHRVAVITLAVTLSITALASAQERPSPRVARSFQDLSAQVEPGTTVSVIDTTGNEITGKIAEISSSSLVLLVDGAERRFEATRVKRIERRDSLWNGALIGATIGAVGGWIVAGLGGCPAGDSDGRCPGTRAVVIIFQTGIFAAIGTGIDALIPGRTTLYVVPTAPASADRERSGTLANGVRAGVNLSFAW